MMDMYFVSSDLTYGASLLRNKYGDSIGDYIPVLELNVPKESLQQDPDNPHVKISLVIRGDVTSDYFRYVYLLDNPTLKVLFKTPYHLFEEKFQEFKERGESDELFYKVKNYGGEIFVASFGRRKLVHYKNVLIEDVIELSDKTELYGCITSEGDIYFSESMGIDVNGENFYYSYNTNTIVFYDSRREDIIKNYIKNATDKFNFVFGSVLSTLKIQIGSEDNVFTFEDIVNN